MLARLADRFRLLPLVFCAAVYLSSPPPLARAAITATGDVEPTNPSTWASYTPAYIGNTSAGTLTVNGGSSVLSGSSYVGYNSGTAGTVNIDGTGSAWYFGESNLPSLTVGPFGTGTLHITNGGIVTGPEYSSTPFPQLSPISVVSVGEAGGSTGTVAVSGPGSSLNCRTVNLGCNEVAGFVNGPGTASFSVSGGAIAGGYYFTGGYAYGVVGAAASTIDGAAGTAATIDGAGSQWYCSSLLIGVQYSGTLNIANGGLVGASGPTCVGGGFYAYDVGTGAVNFGGTGGTLETQSLAASPSQLTGTGTVDASGLVSDVDLVFNSTHPLNQTITLNSLPGQNITVNLNMGSYPSDNGDLGAGWKGSGSLTIKDGLAVASANGYLGRCTGSSGTATISGTGSTWTNSGSLYVGYDGSGTLNIANGGTVSVNGTTYVAYDTGASGAINFGTNGGTLTTGSLCVSPNQLIGTGTVNASGLVSDANLVFDSTHGLKQTITFNSLPGQNVTLNLDMATSPSSNGDLGAGLMGTGSLAIRDGVSVASSNGYLGYNSGSTGTAIVSGASSAWINSGSLYVGYGGSGTLTITNGGTVGSEYANIGNLPGSTGTVTVEGAGSTFTNSGEIYLGAISYVGGPGAGSLNVRGGGTVSAAGLSIGTGSLVTIDVGRGSSLNVGGEGSNTLGALRVLAAAGVTAGAVYSPISREIWSIDAAYQAVGGTWNATNYQFTVSATQPGSAGTPVSIDLSQEQRVLVSDIASGESIGASFLAATTPTPITFTASLVSGATLTSLTGLLGSGESVASAWACSATGYASGNPAYLSFSGVGNGGGYYRDGLEVWSYSGGSWASFSANDLTYDGTYASFTVTAFGSFAVTGTAVLPGDAIGDGKVDINDLTIVLTNYGKTDMTWSQGEFAGDGTVDINDLTIVLANFGQTAGAAGIRAVPEPATIAILLAGAACLLAFAWRRRRRAGGV